MRIAVTGASGFVGRHVLNELVHNDVQVIAAARDTSRLKEYERICQIVEFDITRHDYDCFERLGKPDVLIHLAWGGLPNYNSLHHFEIELPSHFQFLKRMIESGLMSLLVAGTCFEYGMQSGPLAADTLTAPINPYGYAKDALRKQLKFLQAQKRFNFTWMRLFYMYGEGQSHTSLFSLLHDAVRNGEKVFNMSGGEQLRDYLHVSEVARQIVQYAKKNSDIGVVNICSGEPISVRNLVENWLRENDWGDIVLNFGHYPYPDYEPMAFWGVANNAATAPPL